MIRITFVRNCTMILEYGGKKFVVDPMFRAKGETEELPSTLHAEKPPLTDLPMNPQEIMNGADAVLVTHIHPGHLDKAAGKLVPETMPFFVQNILDKDNARKFGLKKTQTINMNLSTHLGDIKVLRTAGVHGDGKIMDVLNDMENSSGIVLQKDKEKTVFITGDTVWCYGLEQGLGYNPDVIVAYLGACRAFNMRYTMNLEDLEKLHRTVPKAKIVCVHMDTFENKPLTRQQVRAWAFSNGLQDQILVPENGETLSFE